MTRLARLCALTLSLFLLVTAAAVPLAAQSAVTGKCKDGTTTSAKTKSGACRGHGGVAEWTGTPGAAPTATTAAATKPKSKPSAAVAATPTASTNAGIPCKDGTFSNSKSKSGACRGHGGIAKSLGASVTAPARATAPAQPQAAPTVTTAAPAKKPSMAAVAPAGPAPEGATAQCKDGTYSKAKHRSGACAHHGGVSQWLSGNR